MSAIVNVQNLSKQYKPPQGIMAVEGVTFEIQEGEIFSLLGPNGAGKSTTISMLSCLLTPTSGQILIDGHPLATEPRAVKRVIGVVPQDIALYPTISAHENLAFWGKLYGLRGHQLKSRIDTVLDIAGLQDRAEDKVETYSGGMKRRLNIAVALLHEPKVLYMDEPTVGIDPQSRRRILDTVKTLQSYGLTVLYTTHYMEEAEELSDRIGIMDHGKLIALGSQEELVQMTGGYDLIRIQIETNSQAHAAVMADIASVVAQQMDVMGVQVDDDELLIQSCDTDRLLASIILTITEKQGHIKGLRIQAAGLETVFLHLTGRELRD